MLREGHPREAILRESLYREVMADYREQIGKTSVMQSAARIGKIITIGSGQRYDVQLSDGRIISGVNNSTNIEWAVNQGVTMEWSGIDWYVVGVAHQVMW